MKGMLSVILAGILSLAVVDGSTKKVVGAGGFPTKEELKAVPMITKEELKPMLGNPDMVIIDIRVKRRWQRSKVKIPGAFREKIFGDIKSWEDKYPKEKTLVLY